ncbi:S66 family peptidase [Anaerocolumna xylanovorans]|uniref:Muramoyltetrapeptide carboxypeptidase LdcA (Peptidoglycan recycling) n=1 Tax=Anaerocolumna xylanovorans DSM 12503 TaxID=1121345 RepID=A0A1M7YE65_9FIRM|nr:S66 peptidase family protein [Anaerocolumna xylanovorans]SHO50940.1 Muramoyltetrapeptide carboxypeptidase LdcA (peptidoglycan recycling) [Anaerocolumna xylanovorans DSM 12503]
MIYPNFITGNDLIAVAAPSDGNQEKTDFNRLDNAVLNFKNRGFQVIEGPLVRKSEKGRSGSGKDRGKELNDLLKNKEIKWIIGTKGGDFLVEMLPYFDYEAIKRRPVWYQGFSDNTGLTFTITTRCDIATIYGSNFNSFGMSEWHPALENNLKVLMGKNTLSGEAALTGESLLAGSAVLQESFDLYEDGYYDRITGLEGYVLTKPVVLKQIAGKEGEPVKGRLLGGCLDVLLNLCGTRFDNTLSFIEGYKEDGILWYLESFALNSDSLIRGLWQLKEAGWFQYAKGFVFGRSAFCEESYGISYEEAVTSVVKDVPIIINADIGHKAPSLTIINGSMGSFVCRDGKGSLTMEYR